MPTYTDIRQTAILALEAQGADSLTIVRQGIREVHDALATLDAMQADGLGPREYLAQQQRLGAELRKLQALEKEITATLNEEVRARIDALAREERAMQQVAVAAEEAAGRALRARIEAAAREERQIEALARAAEEAAGRELRARIDAIARAERAREAEAAAAHALVEQQIADQARLQAALGGMNKRDHDRAAEGAYEQQLRDEAALNEYLGRKEQEAAQAAVEGQARAAQAHREGAEAVRAEIAAIEAARVAAIEAMGQRAQSHARAERQQEQATAAAIQAAGDEKRARIDSAASAEQAEERLAAKIRAANQAILQEAGKLKRERIDAYAAADEAVQRHKATVQQAAQAIVAAEDREHDELEQLNRAFQHNAQNVGMATAATREQIQALKDMGIIQDKVNVGARSGAGAFGGFATAAEQAADKNNRMGYAMLNVSYAVQDLQYGMGAVANNIGLVTQSIGNAIPKFASMTSVVGGPAGVGAILMGLGVAADILYHNWDKVTGLFGQGVPPKLLIDLDAAKKHLEELEKKKWKTDLDYRKITEAREELRKLTEEESAYEALKNKRTREQQKRAETVEEAIVEGGGGDDRTSSAANVASAVEATMPLEDTAESIADKAKVAEAEARMKAERPESMMYAQWKRVRDEAADRLKFTEAAQIKNRRKAAEGLVTRAAGGNELALSQLGGMFQAHPEAFAAAGVDPLRFGAGLEMAAPDRLFAEERRKHEEETRKKDEAAIKKRADDEDRVRKQVDAAKAKRLADAEADASKRIGQGVGGNVAGVDDKLEKSIHDAIQGGSTREAAIKAERGGLVHTLRGRGVEEDIVGDVASKILEKAADRAQNILQEGGKTKLDLKKEAADRKADADRDKEVGKVDQAFTTRAMAMMAANDLAMAQGAPVARNKREEDVFRASNQPYALPVGVLERRIDQKTAYDLRNAGKDPSLATDIRVKAAESYQTRAAEAMARTPTPDPTQAMALYGDQMGRNMARQSQAIAALIDILTGLTAQNMTQANAINQNVTKINHLGGNMQRNRNMKPSSSMMLGF